MQAVLLLRAEWGQAPPLQCGVQRAAGVPFADEPSAYPCRSLQLIDGAKLQQCARVGSVCVSFVQDIAVSFRILKFRLGFCSFLQDIAVFFGILQFRLGYCSFL